MPTPDHGQHGGHQAVETAGEQLGDRVDVASQSGSDTAGGVPVVEGHVESLEVGEHSAPQRKQHVLPDPTRDAHEDDPAQRLQQHRDDHGGHDLQQGTGAAAGDDRRQSSIDSEPDEPRQAEACGVLDEHDRND